MNILLYHILEHAIFLHFIFCPAAILLYLFILLPAEKLGVLSVFQTKLFEITSHKFTM
jgi:hypothetical protein